MHHLDVRHQYLPVELALVCLDVHQAPVLADEPVAPRRSRVLRRGAQVVVLVGPRVGRVLDGMSREQGLVTVDDRQTLGGHLDQLLPAQVDLAKIGGQVDAGRQLLRLEVLQTNLVLLVDEGQTLGGDSPIGESSVEEDGPLL